jgi:SET domain-containing protein
MILPIGLIIKQSPIQGNGVFATQYFPAGFCFGPFTGTTMNIKDFHSIYGKDYRYCYRLGRINKIICAKEYRNFITYINDGIHNQPIPNINVMLKKKALYAVHDINPGDELLLDYGYSYPW